MAITLMTTTGSLPDVQAALGIAAGSAPAPDVDPGPIAASVEALPKAEPATEPSETPEAPPVETAPQDATPQAAEPEVPDSEFDEDGEPLTERAARSSRTKLQTIKKLRARARHAETELARREGELAALRALQTPSTTAAEPVQTGMDSSEPKEADYATYEAWIEARADYRARQAVREELQQRQTQDAETRQRESLAERIRAFEKDHPDYQELVSNPELQLTRAIAETLTVSEDGPALAYALAKDVPRFKRIASLPPVLAIRALGELSAELRLGAQPKVAEAAPPPKVPAAPPPPTPVRGGSVAASVSLEDFAKTIQPGDPKTSEWIRRRNEQLRRAGQR